MIEWSKKEWNANKYNKDAHNCADFVRAVLQIEKEEGKALSQQVANYTEKPIQYAQRGNVVFNKNFSHCGVCLNYPYIAHYTADGVIIESYIYNFAGGYAYGTVD